MCAPKVSVAAIRSRSPTRKIGLIELGLSRWSVAMRDVSEVPRGCVLSSSEKKPPSSTLQAKTFPSLMYWLPIAEARFSQAGLFGSVGGLVPVDHRIVRQDAAMRSNRHVRSDNSPHPTPGEFFFPVDARLGRPGAIVVIEFAGNTRSENPILGLEPATDFQWT